MSTLARRSRAPLLAIVLLIAAGHLATLREGHDWSGDNAAYILHARNLLEGRAYDDIGLLFNSASLQDEYYLPLAYPPVLPALLTPLYALWGSWLLPMKALLVASFASALFGLGVLAEVRMGRAASLATVAIVGTNPVLWKFTEWVASEFVFFTAIVGTLLLVDRIGKREEAGRGVWSGLAVGIAVFICYATRSVGALLLPALLITDLLRARRPSRVTCLAALVFVPLAVAQSAALNTASGHFAYKLFHLTPELLWQNVTRTYPSVLSSFWSNGYWDGGAALVTAGALALASFGLVDSLRRRESGVLDAFAVVYLLFFLAIRFDDTRPPERYLIPAFPFLAFLAVRGLHGLAKGRTQRVAGVAFGSVVTLSYVASYTTQSLSPLNSGSTGPFAHEVYDFIRKNTRTDEPVVMWEPRVLTLYTGRPATQFASFWDVEERRDYARAIGARFWVHPRRELPPSFAQLGEPAFENALLTVYRLRLEAEPTARRD